MIGGDGGAGGGGGGVNGDVDVAKGGSGRDDARPGAAARAAAVGSRMLSGMAMDGSAAVAHAALADALGETADALGRRPMVMDGDEWMA